MSKVKVAAFSISLDGFGAGVDQSLENPLGIRGGELHQWMYPTKMFHEMQGKEGGSEGVDNDFAMSSFDNLGAWILGRNMFGPIRGPWPDGEWKGWWGDTPPYHVPVFVLTNYEREPLEMKGGTTFYFVTDGIESALDKARKAANGKDVRIGGGVSTVRQVLQLGQMDEMHLAMSPVLLGKGEHLFSGMDLPKLGFKSPEMTHGEKAIHLLFQKE